MVRWVIRRKRLDATIVARDGVRDEIVRLTGEDRVPVLLHGELAVAGSTPIAYYLERTFPDPSIFPADPQKRNQAVTLNEFGDKAIGWLTRSLAGVAEDVDLGEPIVDPPEAMLAGLHEALGQVRHAVFRKALDSGACHLGDLSVAAHLVSCREIPELRFAADYPDLDEYVEGIRALIEG